MDQSNVKPHINIALSLEEKMSHWITLFLEHIVIVGLDNYKYILKEHTSETYST
jgi:hypothetical protein